MTPTRTLWRGRRRRHGSRDETLVKALVRAHRRPRKIESGQAKPITDLAEQEGMTDSYVCRVLALEKSLAPGIVEANHDGRQPKGPLHVLQWHVTELQALRLL